MFRSTTSKIILFLLVLAVLGYAFVLGPAQDCSYLGKILDRPSHFHPVDGCWLQTVDGSWQRVAPSALPGNP